MLRSDTQTHLLNLPGFQSDNYGVIFLCARPKQPLSIHSCHGHVWIAAGAALNTVNNLVGFHIDNGNITRITVCYIDYGLRIKSLLYDSISFVPCIYLQGTKEILSYNK